MSGAGTPAVRAARGGAAVPIGGLDPVTGPEAAADLVRPTQDPR